MPERGGVARGAGRRSISPQLLIRYILFAVAATLVNLLTQELVVRSAPLMLSIIAGTAVGFLLKYLLDKNWIFRDRYTGPAHEARKVVLYGLFSVLTTALFWAVELTFWWIWRTSFAKYSGAVLGLGIGYAAKYLLDRRFVFRDRLV